MKSTIIILAILCPFLSMCQPITLQGKVIDGEGSPVAGATVMLVKTTDDRPRTTEREKSIDHGPLSIAATKKIAISDKNGEWKLENGYLGDTVIVSAIGYETSTELVNERGLITTTLRRKVTALDEAIVIAYGQTTRRLNTGNIGKLSAADIDKQPVQNPLAALSGRIPGLVITQTSGLPGAGIKVQIRGQNSLAQGSDPLFIIDGVPFAPNNDIVNQFGSALGTPGSVTTPGGISPFSTINPADIESIEVLKDADATAIYGSRGANGVILITTKRARAGKTRLELNHYSGFSRATRLPEYLNTEQYISIRQEAFANDGLTATAINAPDLLVWDQTRYMNFRDLLLGGTARVFSTQLNLSGGTAFTRFVFGAGHKKETTLFPGGMKGQTSSARLQVDHSSADKRFKSLFTANYSSGHSSISSLDPFSAVSLPPNAPALYTPDGELNWEEGGVYFDNPLAYLRQTYSARTENLLANMQLHYQILKGLQLKSSFGYNVYSSQEEKQNPIAAQNPAYSPLGYADFGNARTRSWIAEPQLHYQHSLFGGKLELLSGLSMQEVILESSKINASGYASDALLHSTAGAGLITASTNFNQYKYMGAFARLNYNFGNQYIFNLSGRRDGSSRFGPGNQFANFGAAGIAWIFSSTKLLQQHFPVLSFGKLRASYGSAGNDQIGNYQYLSTWTSTAIYQGVPGLRPSRLFNPDYHWELNRKLEFGLETGWLEDKVSFNLSYYRNRSRNQLTGYILPSQTGFSSVTENLDAVIQNSGVEGSGSIQLISRKQFHWSTNFNFSLQRNRLLAFPGLASSSYASTYIIGEPLSIIYGYHYTGVDPSTGVYTFEDVNGDGLLNNADFVTAGSTDPVFYGGWGQRFSAGNFTADLFIEFRQQQGLNYLSTIYYPGSSLNQPVQVLQRWQKPGDIALLQRLTTGLVNSAAVTAQDNLGLSDGIYSDASFIRLKNLSVAYSLPASLLQRMKLSLLRFYIQGQNLFTITRYQQTDPETQRINGTPAMRTITAGIQLQF